MSTKTIFYEEVEERLKNVPLEKYTEQDVFDRYVVYGEDYELAQPEVQKLFIKYGMIEDLVTFVDNIVTDKEVIDGILSSNMEYEVVRGKLESIDFTELEDKELAKGGLCWLIVKLVDEKEKRHRFKYMYYPLKQENYKNEIIQNIGKEIMAVVEYRGKEDCRLKCLLKDTD